VVLPLAKFALNFILMCYIKSCNQPVNTDTKRAIKFF
jgi:hypothetical protein